mgnify:CR=1 FL=1
MFRNAQYALHHSGSLIASIGIVVATASSLAAEPSFDCAKAKGAVEEMVCKDAGLAALDRKLAEVYATALRKFKGQNYEDPRPLQRGWVKGRNDCWKAGDMRRCVERNYRHRIAELQIAYGDFVVPSTITYACGDFHLATVFYRETNPPTVVLTPLGHDGTDQVIAFLSPSGSGARYEAANVSFWEHHGEAMLTWFGEETTCQIR